MKERPGVHRGGGGRQIQVQKEDRSLALYDPDDISNSLVQAGALTEDVRDIAREIERMAHPGMTRRSTVGLSTC